MSIFQHWWQGVIIVLFAWLFSVAMMDRPTLNKSAMVLIGLISMLTLAEYIHGRIASGGIRIEL